MIYLEAIAAVLLMFVVISVVLVGMLWVFYVIRGMLLLVDEAWQRDIQKTREKRDGIR